MSEQSKNDAVRNFLSAMSNVLSGPSNDIPPYGSPLPPEYIDFSMSRTVDVYAEEDKDGIWSMITTRGIVMGQKKEMANYAKVSFEVAQQIAKNAKKFKKMEY